MSIPKIIWQTYKSAKLPGVAQSCASSWKRVNPHWNYMFADDAGIESFARDNLAPHEFDVFVRLPLGVMRADFWRYAVLYTHGGIYADVDTVCRVRAELWCEASKGLVTGVEDTMDLFCQWVIAAQPGHPVLREAIDLIVERARDGFRTDDPYFVHYHTGPGLWTDAIRRHLVRSRTLANAPFSESEVFRTPAQQIFEATDLWQPTDVQIHPWTVLCGGAVQHMFASKRWITQPSYQSWRATRPPHDPKAA